MKFKLIEPIFPRLGTPLEGTMTLQCFTTCLHIPHCLPVSLGQCTVHIGDGDVLPTFV